MAPSVQQCPQEPHKECKFTDEDVSNLRGLARRRDDIVDSINIAKRSTIFPKWALYLLISAMMALGAIAYSNRTAIALLQQTVEQTHIDIRTIADAVRGICGPAPLLPLGTQAPKKP